MLREQLILRSSLTCLGYLSVPINEFSKRMLITFSDSLNLLGQTNTFNARFALLRALKENINNILRYTNRLGQTNTS